MNPPRRPGPARASLGPQRVGTPQRTTRSRASVTPSFGDQSTPLRATRGNIANTYGDDDARPIGSGVVEFKNAQSVAEQLQQQMEEKQRLELRETQSRRETTRPRQESPQQLVHSSSGLTSSPPNLRQGSRERSRLESPFQDTTLPSGGIDPVERVFDDTHEGGLAVPMGYWRAVLNAWDGIKARGKDWVMTLLIAIALFLLLMGTLSYGPAIGNWMWMTLCYLRQGISRIRIPLPSLPTANIPSLSVPASSAESTPTSAAESVTTKHSSWLGESAQQKELNRLERIVSDLTSKDSRREARQRLIEAPNFFSPKLGVIIDPVYTSPTHSKGRSFLTRSAITLLRGVLPDPPLEALTPWNENGDCWCAASSPKGALTIGINLGEPLHPEAFMYSHIAKRSARNITTAPKQFEIWARTTQGTTLEQIPYDLRDNAQGCEGKAPTDFKPKKGWFWVCFGNMHYDIDGEDNVQVKSLNRYGERSQFTVDKFVVRVAENWGNPANYTCLYTLKLLAEPGLAGTAARHAVVKDEL